MDRRWLLGRRGSGGENGFAPSLLDLYVSTNRQPEPAVRRVDGEEDEDQPEVPIGVLPSIEDLAERRTVDENNPDEFLKF